MQTGNGFLGFGQIIASAAFKQVGIAHALFFIFAEQNDFGLRPFDGFTIFRIALHAPAEPCRVSAAPFLSVGVVEPVKIFSVFTLPNKICRSGVLHLGAVGKALIARRIKGASSILASRVTRHSVYGTEHVVNGAVRQGNKTVFFGNSCAGGALNALGSLRQCFPPNFFRVFFRQQIVAF